MFAQREACQPVHHLSLIDESSHPVLSVTSSDYHHRLLGLCNNFAYVVMLSAAHDILKTQESGNATASVRDLYLNLLSKRLKAIKQMFHFLPVSCLVCLAYSRISRGFPRWEQ